jgi:argininosuccinate lyase
MKPNQKLLWGGRFQNPPDSRAMDFSSSLGIDLRLIEEDIEGSVAHARMLAQAKFLNETELKQIEDGLATILAEWRKGEWRPDPARHEDIHSAIEVRLAELTGPVAGKLPTGRSRNDQVATDEKLWLRKACKKLREHNRLFQRALVKLAEDHVDTIMPGYTHLQRAQPVSLAYHLLAYVEMIERDKQRLSFVEKTISDCPLGSGALAGSTLSLDREFTARALGFEKPTTHALDSVANRDYFLDFLNACCVGMMHLGRLAEELVLWSTKEWNFVTLTDAWTTGSSLMPQKKNPDMAELIRGRVGRVYGYYMALATTLKGLPLSYNRDLQEDKEPVFAAHDAYEKSLAILAEMMSDVKINASRFVDEILCDFSEATDMADRLVMKGMPFREAHERVGQLVRLMEEQERTFSTATTDEIQKHIPEWNDEDQLWLRLPPLERKKTPGSPNPKNVREMIVDWKSKINA